MANLVQDLKYGARMLLKHPGMTITAMLTLALGICANSTILSWIGGTMFDPVPGAAATSSLVTVQVGERTDNPVPPLSHLDYRDFREALRGRTFTDLLAYHDDWVTLTDNNRPERHYGALVTANYFTVLDVPMALGRGFGAAEDAAGPGGAPVVVISDALWKTRYASARNVVGRSMEINRRVYTIVGVAPAAFQGCKPGMRTELWAPLAMDTEVWGGQRLGRRDIKFLNVMGRLAPRVSIDAAAAAAGPAMARIARDFPVPTRGPVQVLLDPLWRSPFGANVYLAGTLPFLLGVSGVVLLLACANVANLLLVRSVARRREFAIRLAMGASRWRLVRQSLIESALLALGGAGLALVATAWTSDLLQALMPPFNNPVVLSGRLDGRVAAATVVLAILGSLAAGILPALRSTHMAPVEVLNDESGRSSGGIHRARLTRSLVVAQVALSLLLLVCAGLFVRSLNEAERANPGFEAGGVLLTSFDLSPSGYRRDPGLAFQRELLSRVRALPGVTDAAMADWVPLTFSRQTRPIEIDGYTPKPDEDLDLRRAAVSPGYFSTLRLPVVAGREFSPTDTTTSEPVAMVDETFANRYWPGQDAIGKRIKIGRQWWTVVGVARASRHHRVNEAPEPMFYQSVFQDYRTQLVLHVRAAGDPAALAPAVRSVLRGMDATVPAFDAMSMTVAIRVSTVLERVGGTFVGTFGLVALLLAAVGIYGVLSYTTRQRTRELGIRMALGAARLDVFRFVVADGLRLTLAGLFAGPAAAFTLSRVVRGRLFGVSELDVLTYAAVVAVLALVAVAACAVPAWRAARVEPLEALRVE